MERDRRGTALALAGVALLVGTLAVGALTAPSVGADADGDDGDDRRRTLVGSQSTRGGWHDGGAVLGFEGAIERWREESAANYFEVSRLPDGRVLAGFSHGGYEEGCAPYEPPCHKTGYRIVDPDAEGGPAVVEEYAFPVRYAANSEVHGVDRLPSGEVLVADMERERLITVSDGTVTWEWSASSFYEPPGDPTRTDWLHLNDVDAINATHYLTSVRNANQLLIVERGAGVVEVVNADDGGADDECTGPVAGPDGDARCGDPDVLNRQHNPQWLDEGAVLVADSDNDRVVELHRNGTTGEWEPAWTARSVGGVDLDWPRDADRLANGNTLITDTFNSRAVEVTPNGTAVWSLQLYNLPYEADRLPDGERQGARRYAREETVVDPSDEVPVLTVAVGGLKGQYRFVPFWFAETHLAGTAVGLALVVVGGLDRLLVRFGVYRAVVRRIGRG